MQSNKKRMSFLNHDCLINHPIMKKQKSYFIGCKKCNNYPQMDESYCEICQNKIFDDD